MADKRIDILDGWRALSILMVLAGHWFPLGPKSWQLNAAVAAGGMAIFFVLSGFLIARLLLADPRVPNFLIRRMFRIVPLAYVAIIALAIWRGADFTTVAANLMFIANLPPEHLMNGGEHLWSLCVEMQFYLGIALIVLVAGKRGIFVLPLLAALVTAGRIVTDTPISIVTWQRVDEILAGAIVAILLERGWLAPWARRLPPATPILLLPVLVLAAHPAGGTVNYLRPYLAAAAVGVSIFAAPGAMRRLFVSRPARYVAALSYALYVVHGVLSATWLGAGDTLVKYARRPLLVAATFAVAHASTFWYEARMIELGKRLAIRASPTGRTV